MSHNLKYPAQVFYSEEDEGFIAIATDLPGCSAFGETQVEALAELQDAITVWISAATKAGNPVPPPSTQNLEPLPSGKILLRMPRTLHSHLIDRSKQEGVSLNQYISATLAASIAAEFARTALDEQISELKRQWQQLLTINTSGVGQAVMMYVTSHVDQTTRQIQPHVGVYPMSNPIAFIANKRLTNG